MAGKITLVLAFASYLVAAMASAAEMETYNAKAVLVKSGQAQLLRHASLPFGLQCKSGPVGSLPKLRQVRLGDTIELEKHKFKVGVIQVHRYTEDQVENGRRTAKKGDKLCLAAADEAALPSADDCKALWVYVPDCQPF